MLSWFVVNSAHSLPRTSQGFVQPLRAAQPPIIAPEHVDAFLAQILLNLSDIREHSRMLLAALLARQRETPYVVKNIGDVVLSAALDWGPAYTAFTIRFPLADSIYKEEKARNPRFKEFFMVRQGRRSTRSQLMSLFRTGLPKASRSDQARIRYLPVAPNLPGPPLHSHP